MKLKATDTIHLSSVRPEPLTEGEKFEIDDAAGKHLVRRGLAVEVAEKKKAATKPAAAPATKPASPPATKPAAAPATKAAAAPDNKRAAEPANKAAAGGDAK